MTQWGLKHVRGDTMNPYIKEKVDDIIHDLGALDFNSKEARDVVRKSLLDIAKKTVEAGRVDEKEVYWCRSTYCGISQNCKEKCGSVIDKRGTWNDCRAEQQTRSEEWLRSLEEVTHE